MESSECRALPSSLSMLPRQIEPWFYGLGVGLFCREVRWYSVQIQCND